MRALSVDDDLGDVADEEVASKVVLADIERGRAGVVAGAAELECEREAHAVDPDLAGVSISVHGEDVGKISPAGGLPGPTCLRPRGRRSGT